MEHKRSFQRRQRLTVGAAVAITATLTLAGCAGGNTTSGGTGEAADQTLAFGVSGEFPVLRTGVNQGNLGWTQNALIHRGLVTYDAEGSVTPALAESYEQIDPATYSFTLHEGLTFHDGTPITSQTVADTLNYYATPESASSGYSAFRHIASIETPDELTAIIHLDANNSAFLQYLADPSSAIVPATALNADTPNTIGAGPFKIAAQEEGVGTTLEAFNDYYDAEDVQLDGIDVRYYADGTARTNALLSGDVDLIDYVPWEQFATIEADSNFVLTSQAGPLIYVQFNTTDGPFADPLVRKAVATAINRDNINATVLEGNGTPVYGLAIPGGEFDDAATDMYTYDPDEAKEVLAEAGYPDGFSTELSATSQYAFLQDAAISVQADLKEIGIEVTLNTPDWPTYTQNAAAGNYEIGVSGGGGSLNDPAYLVPWLGGPASFVNSFGYDNAELNAALQAGISAADEDERATAYGEAFSIVEDETPIVQLIQRAQGFAHSSKLEGFTNLPGFLTFYSAYTLAGAHLTD
ncbi:ABC transporter substrate-binding protein [Microbacterium sp. NPDC056044]|uniref:ABC transporter substrate-binding protein n=1 Tax=Microbacterium sp. NPDC056044 TaxID=3345690 RepID=UPI0035DCC356